MNRTMALSFVLTVALISCKTSDKEKGKELSKLAIAKQYYKALDKSNVSSMLILIGDSIVIRENMDNYEERFSQRGYGVWLAWDSVFEPTYKILDIVEANDMVKAKIWKIDKRISFLHEEPMVWNEIIRFDGRKIARVERMRYEVFSVDRFVKNRDTLVNWINEYHPELSGFLYPQTKSLGKKYLKAIEIYQNKK